jgi:outer membrane protein
MKAISLIDISRTPENLSSRAKQSEAEGPAVCRYTRKFSLPISCRVPHVRIFGRGISIAERAVPTLIALLLALTAHAQNNVVNITREQAEAIAIKQNPRIAASRLLALAEGQVTRETRSALLPQIDGNITAAKAEDGSRITAGDLTASRLYTKAAAGGELTQLLTDFGHTSNLVASQKLHQRAQEQTALATEQDILFATDQAFYQLAEAQAILQVAQQTVAERGSVRDLTQSLATNKLKSDLDLNFAAADYSQAKLLQLDAQTNMDRASATLAALLAAPPSTTYRADDAGKAPPAPPDDEKAATTAAFAQRPDLAALQSNVNADQKFARAQKLQAMPSISAIAVGGSTPVRPDGVVTPNWYGAAGVNLNIPLFTGFRINAQGKEAQYRAEAEAHQASDLTNTIARDVRVATLTAQAAFERIGVTEAFRSEADQALNLAKTRYQLGLSSIVELSQAQLQSTQAEAAAVNARFSYLLALRSVEYVTGQIR